MVASILSNQAEAEAPAEDLILAEPEPSIETLKVPEVMLKVANCESGNRQFNDDGTVIRGRENNQDVGRFQINEYYHLETSKKLGIDIYTWEGNTEYAMWLYENEGLTPWNWSRHCWGN